MIRTILAILRELLQLRGMIWAMARRELAARYVGTVGGMVWAIVQPLATVVVFWFVFSVGFKAQGPNGSSFILYFLCGYIPWLFFSEVLQTSATAITGNAHLVKKTLFPTQILPLIQMASAGVAHAVLLAILAAAVLIRGKAPFAMPQVVYYFGALCCLSLGLAWLLAAIQVFYRDVTQILGIVLNLWFWLTPIVWNEEIMPAEFHWAIDWNPMAHIVHGYRHSFLDAVPVWHDPAGALRFWLLALPVLLFGALVFRRLKPDFADVL